MKIQRDDLSIQQVNLNLKIDTNTIRNIEICGDIAVDVQKYIENNLFDKCGIMYSYIDSHTSKPFDKDFITPLKVSSRAAFDPWSYWTYEDSIMTMGLYLDGLILRYQITEDEVSLKRAGELWKVIYNVYSSSQIYGIGSFIRPYGGFLKMHQFMEPLGTDQASPLFSALYRYLPYVKSNTQTDIQRVMINMLTWYEQQNFDYFYYKTLIHSYAPESGNCNHANSYYLPAIAWAAKNYAGDIRWKRHLDERLGYFIDKKYLMYPQGSHQPGFCWGSDLDVLCNILGERFFDIFNQGKLDEAYQAVNEVLKSYSEPGFVRRDCPGRTRPRHEIDFLLALASVGYRTQECIEHVAGLMVLRSSIPDDFTNLLSEDYDLLPDTVHLYARSVGTIMVEWWRNYWLLRNILNR